jgi:hypothetical protein
LKTLPQNYWSTSLKLIIQQVTYYGEGYIWRRNVQYAKKPTLLSMLKANTAVAPVPKKPVKPSNPLFIQELALA